MRNGREATKLGYSLGSSPNAGKLCALLCTDTLPPPLSFPLNAAFRAWGAAAPGDQRDRPTKGVRLIPHTPFHSGSRSHIGHYLGRRNHTLQEVARHHPNPGALHSRGNTLLAYRTTAFCPQRHCFVCRSECWFS